MDNVASVDGVHKRLCPLKRKESAMADNKPQGTKETEEFSIRRLVFWLSVAGAVYSAGVQDFILLAISVIVFLMTVVAKLISMARERE
jgi:hypothetical protein